MPRNAQAPAVGLSIVLFAARFGRSASVSFLKAVSIKQLAVFNRNIISGFNQIRQ